jgi:hypothetical protein
MTSDSRFLFTFNEAPGFKQVRWKEFYYPLSFFQSLADAFSFQLEDRSREYRHPKGQRMAVLSKREHQDSIHRV